MDGGFIQLKGKFSYQLAQNGLGIYNDSRLILIIPLETAKEFGKDLPKQLKKYGLA